MDLDSLIDIILPGDSNVAEATILEWLKSPGEFVTEHEPILEVTTDKVTMEVAAPASGQLVEMIASPETVVYPGTVLGRIERVKVAVPTQEELPANPAHDEDYNVDAVQGTNESARLSPLVRRMLREHNLTAESVRGTGRGGRITHRDILAHLDGADSVENDPGFDDTSPETFEPDSPEFIDGYVGDSGVGDSGDGAQYYGDDYSVNGEGAPTHAVPFNDQSDDDVADDALLYDGQTTEPDSWTDPVSTDESEWFNPPADSTLAPPTETSVQDQEEGNLWGFLRSDNEATEPNSADAESIVGKDRHDYRTGEAEPPTEAEAHTGPDDTSFAFESEINERRPHSFMRRSIAQHMVDSVRTAPHVTSVFDADMSRVIAHREANRSEAERRGIRLTFTSYFIAAVARAIKVVPQANSVWHDDGLEIIRHANVGVATSLEDDGLIVPVVQNADELDLLGIARRLQDLVSSARNGALSKADVSGGTITITNHGVSGSLIATPIINQPQSAILGVGRLEKRVVVREHAGRDSIEIAPMVYVTLTIDHRALDGHQANKFLTEFVSTLENWE